MRDGKLKVVFNSQPVEFTPETVVLNVHGQPQTIPNDFVWIFAGGMPPKTFLQKIGVEFGMRDMTKEAGQEARQTSVPIDPSSQRSLSETLG